MGKELAVPSLSAPEVQNQSDAQLTEAISKGKNKMPAYDGKLSKEQIASLGCLHSGAWKEPLA